MAAATYAVRDAIERAEKLAGTSVASVWIGCSGAGLASRIAPVEIEIGGRRIEEEDIEHLLVSARERASSPTGAWCCTPSRRATPSTAPKASPIPRASMPSGSAVDIHVMLADGAPMRNLTEAVQNAHLEVEAVVASPLATGYACLTAEERDLGVALVEFGARGHQRLGLHAAACWSGWPRSRAARPTSPTRSPRAFGIRRFQAERLKCVYGSAIASPADHREMIPVNGPGRGRRRARSRAHADDKQPHPARRADQRDHRRARPADRGRRPRARRRWAITGQRGRRSC